MKIMFQLDHRIMNAESDLQRTYSPAPGSELVWLDQVLQRLVQQCSEYFDQMFFKYFCVKPKLLQFVLWVMSNRCFMLCDFHFNFQVFSLFLFFSLLTLSVLINIFLFFSICFTGSSPNSVPMFIQLISLFLSCNFKTNLILFSVYLKRFSLLFMVNRYNQSDHPNPLVPL